MRRVGGLWPRVTAFDNLLAATTRAAQGKRHQRYVARFLIDREPLLLALRRELITQTYRPGPMSTFVLHDPKLRTISVAPFRDRVVHHAVIDVLEPVLDRRMLHASFACRRGKGTHAALDHAQRLVRRHTWFLKMDVEKFFASIPHALVLDTLTRIVKDKPVLQLVRQIVEAGGGPEPGRGLPVGNLTSQWFANLVLGPIDRAVVEQLRMPGYVRYMDDFVTFSDDRSRLKQVRAELEQRLELLGLRAKPSATMLAPTRDEFSDRRGQTIGDGNRVMRGGSWNNEARNARSAMRNNNPPGNRNANIGFRPAQGVPLARRSRLITKTVVTSSQRKGCPGPPPVRAPRVAVICRIRPKRRGS